MEKRRRGAGKPDGQKKWEEKRILLPLLNVERDRRYFFFFAAGFLEAAAGFASAFLAGAGFFAASFFAGAFFAGAAFAGVDFAGAFLVAIGNPPFRSAVAGRRNFFGEQICHHTFDALMR